MSSATKQTLTAREKLQAVVAGQRVDHPPATAWVHFASEHLPPQETAALHLRFAEAYQPDLLKIHADYRLRVSRFHDLRSADDLLQIALSAAGSPCFVQQKQCVSAVLASAPNNCVVMDTLFSPFQNLLRNVGKDQLSVLLQYPSQTLEALEQITKASCEHLYWLQEQGVDVCFFATHAAIADEQLAGDARKKRDDILHDWIQPFDKQVLAAASGMTRILHAHGQPLMMAQLQGYEFEVLHVATELAGNPSLSELRQWTHKCLMGGINENTFAGLSLGALAGQIDAARTAAADCGLILAPGCSLPPHTPGRLLKRFLGAGT